MFDDKKEPEDIFSETEPVKPPSGPEVSPGGTPQSLGAPPPAVPGGPSAPAASAGPSRLLLIVAIVIVMGLIAGGIWFFLLRDTEPEFVESPGSTTEDQPLIDDTAPEPEVISDENCGDGVCDLNEEAVCPEDCPLLEEDLCGNGMCDPDEDGEVCPLDCPPEATEPVLEPEPANEPTDTDGDGLSDEEEIVFGTNPQSTDTDSDGLTDGDEVTIYETDPTNPDTDGDTYLDGDEVKAGYNPNGEGRLLNVPQ